MDDKEIILRIKTDASGAVSDVDNLKKKLEDVSDTDLAKPFKTFKQEIKDAVIDAQKMSATYGEFSKQANEANKKVAELRDSQDELNKRIESFNPDNKMQSLVNISKGAIGALQGVAGGMTLLGVESGTAQESIAKLQALMALSDSLSSIDDLKNGFKSFTGIAKQAFSSVKAGIASTGIGLLVIAVGLLIANFDDVKKAVLNFIPGLAKVGEWFGKLYDGITDFIGVTNDSTRAQEAFAKSTQDSIDRTQRWLDTDSDKYDKYTVSKVKAKQDYNDKVLKLDAKDVKQKMELGERLNRDLDAIDKDRIAEGEKNRKDEFDKIKANNDKLSAEAKKHKDEIDAIINGDKLKILTPTERAIKELSDKHKAEQKLLKDNDEAKLLNENIYQNTLYEIRRKSNEDFSKGLEVEKEAVKAVTIVKTELNENLRLNTLGTNDSIVLSNETTAAENKFFASEEAELRIEKLNAIGNATNVLGDIIGKQTVAGKALGIATATINMYQGVSEELKAKSILPSPFGMIAKVTNIAAIIATGLSAIKNIASVKVPGGGGSGSTPSAPSIGSAPVISATATQPQVAQDVRVTNNSDTVIKAYITDKDLQSNQQKTNFLNSISTF